MSSVTLDEVIDFAETELGKLGTPISGDTALAHDFAISGLDGKEFMESFAANYHVSLEDFDWIDYFGAEGVGFFAPFGLLIYLYQRYVVKIPARDLVELPEITLDHLVLCANRGKWEAPKMHNNRLKTGRGTARPAP
ncbi:MAG: DUF1493 family protein [Gammaproteobacteria bacterium]